MIDINTNLIKSLIAGVWSSDAIDYYGYFDEFYSLDFSNEADARYAIRKWLYQDWDSRSYKYKFTIKESLRYMILTGYAGFGDVWLNNIDNDPETPNKPRESIEKWEELYKQFLLWLWDEWFHEPFEVVDLSRYQELTNFPDILALGEYTVYIYKDEIGRPKKITGDPSLPPKEFKNELLEEVLKYLNNNHGD